ncbi:MAG TPA: ABC transporter permease subunit [Isosphaeraceae bacterium]|nr:ABC transporter permease subunit [Isosphaeraceae bacterium]
MSLSNRSPGSVLAGLVLALALILVVGWPAAATVLSAWRGPSAATGEGLLEADGTSSRLDPPLRQAGETLRLVLATEAMALPVGVVLALVLFRTDLWGRRALLGLVALAVFIPLPLHTIAWLGAFGNAGRAQLFGLAPVLVGWKGAAFVHAMAALPWVVLLAGVGLRTVEPELEEAALLDWPAWRVVLGVTLRRGLGAIAGAALAVAVLTAGDMTVTDLLQVRTYAEVAYIQYQLGNGPAVAAAVALPPLIVLGGLVLWAAWGLLRADPARIPSPSTRARLWRLGRWRWLLGLAVWLTVGNAVALPIDSLIWRAGRVGGAAAAGKAPHWSLQGLVGSLGMAWADVVGPLLKSGLWGALGASATVVLAWGLAWVSRRPGAWRWVVAGTVALALATPGPVAGMALVLAYLPPPIEPGTSRLVALLFDIQAAFYDSQAIVLLGYVLRTLPYALLILWPAVRSIPESYLDAAAVDGYGPWGQIRLVALPMTRGATLAAWFAAFALALGELPVTNLVEPPSRTTLLAKRVWELMHYGVESRLAAVGLVMLAAIGAVGLLAAWALGRLYGPRAEDST